MFWNDHTFVVCAYGESPYLERCVKSLKNQRVKSRILMVTSTPNEEIQRLASEYGIPLRVRKGKSSLAADWNFAYEQAKTSYVTLAHQDDVYGKSYLQEIWGGVKKGGHPLILFTDYSELRGEQYIPENSLLRVKRILLWPLKFRGLQKSIFVRRRILAMGNPICCPAVTYAKCSLPAVVFSEGFRSNTDWEAWERLSNLKGSFVYIPGNCMAHRIHRDSTTSKIIGENRRAGEDLVMFSRFWPGWMAEKIGTLYRKSEESNDRGE